MSASARRTSHSPDAPISLIFTVLNEARSLPAVLDSIAAQTRQPDEVVVCDGGSRDATVQLLKAERRFPVRVISAPGANISRGRNIAIESAAHGWIACTDAGTQLHPDWLEQLAAARDAAPDRVVVAGFFEPEFDGPFETAMSATVLPARADIKPETFLPSSRSVAYTKEAWRAVGGYPEWLDYCEDLIFDLALRERFGPYALALDALVKFRPRGSLRSFFRQYYFYARGDGKSGLFFKRHMIRYATYLVALPALLAGIALGGWIAALAALALIGGVGVYTRTPFRRLSQLWVKLSASQRIVAALYVPVIRAVGDIAKMLGYPVGVLWRLRHRRARGKQRGNP
jgi:glycosyltransferase involved in cell wall biosynthesis